MEHGLRKVIIVTTLGVETVMGLVQAGIKSKDWELFTALAWLNFHAKLSPLFTAVIVVPENA